MSKRQPNKPGVPPYRWGEFRGHPAERWLHEACSWLDLPKVSEAFRQLVEAIREEQADFAKWPAKAQKAAERLLQIRPRLELLTLALKPGEQGGEEFVRLTAELNEVVADMGQRCLRTKRELAAQNTLVEMLFLTSADEWKRRTGRERPKNSAELKTAMAEARYKPDVVHADGLTPQFAEDYLLGFYRANVSPIEPQTAVYLGEGLLQIGTQPLRLQGQDELVLEALVDLRAASKTALETKSGVADAVTVLRRIRNTHPCLKEHITLPGKKNAGGYRTTISRPSPKP